MSEPPPDPARPNARSRLLEAAIQIAGTEGQDKVTYRSVAARAGVTHGLVRFHFGTREALLTEAFEYAARRDAAEARLLTDDIETFGSELVRTISDGGGRQILQYDFLLRAVRGGAPMDRVTALYDFYIDQVAGTLENLELDDPDGSLAAMVFATLDGLVLQHAIYGSAERTEQVLRQLRTVLSDRHRGSGHIAPPQG